MGLPFDSRPISSTAFVWATLLFLALSSINAVADDDTPTVYQVLQEYGFPVGLLPKGITDYELNRSTGEFTVHLNSTCTFKIETYELKYKSRIKGVIGKDKLSKLSGIQVKVLFLWLSIAEVTRDVDELEFSVGIASANFGVSNFDECPTCGCGFDCNGNLKSRKINMKRSRPLSSILFFLART